MCFWKSPLGGDSSHTIPGQLPKATGGQACLPVCLLIWFCISEMLAAASLLSFEGQGLTIAQAVLELAV